MKITTTREQLLPAIQRALCAVSRKATIPILDNLLLEVTDDWFVRITGTDLEIQITAEFPIDAAAKPQQGRITLAAGKLYDLVKLLPSGSTLTLEQKGEKCLLTSGRSRFTIGSLPADQYPAFDSEDAKAELTVAGGALRSLIKKVSYAMAVSDVRYYLNGLMIEASGDTLRGVASDGHRLALAEESIEGAGANGQWIIPRKGAAELLKMLDDDKAVVTLHLGENSISASIGTTRFSAKLISGRYPPYEKVIPKALPYTLTAARDALLDGLRRVILISKDEHFGVKLSLDPNNIRLSTANNEGEEADDEIPANFDGELLERAYNAQYLIDALAPIESADVNIRLGGDQLAAVIEDPENDRFRGVVMPMRV